MNIFWKNTVTSGSFTSAANWVQGVVPGPNDVAELTTSGANVIDNSGTTTTVLGLNLVSTGILAVKGNLTATEGTAAGANRGTIDILTVPSTWEAPSTTSGRSTSRPALF